MRYSFDQFDGIFYERIPLPPNKVQYAIQSTTTSVDGVGKVSDLLFQECLFRTDRRRVRKQVVGCAWHLSHEVDAQVVADYVLFDYCSSVRSGAHTKKHFRFGTYPTEARQALGISRVRTSLPALEGMWRSIDIDKVLDTWSKAHFFDERFVMRLP